MTLTTYPEMEQGSQEWFDARCGLLTASVVGNLITSRTLAAADHNCPACGSLAGAPCTSKVKKGAEMKTSHPERAEAARANPTTVLETATGDVAEGLTKLLAAERINGWVDDTFNSFDMQRGHDDEPRARTVYSEVYAPVTEVGFMTEDRFGFTIGCSPDGLVGDKGAIECKSRRPKKHVETVISGQPPAENMAQLQTVLLVSGREWIDYLSYAGGMRMWTKRVYPDPKWFDAIFAAAQTFERNAAAIVAAYNAGVDGCPMTERILPSDMEFTF